MKYSISVLPVLLVIIGILICLLGINKRLSAIECRRCAIWDWEVCDKLDCSKWDEIDSFETWLKKELKKELI